MQTRLLPLELRNIGYRANGRDVLKGISARIQSGSRTVILGPNGAGKSLLLRICHGLLDASEGSVHWQLSDPAGVRSAQTMVFQRPILLRRSALANIVYALKVRGIPRGQRHQRALAALQAVDLAGVAGVPARVLSGGEQQRLALARAWAMEPEVLFLDEPTSSLDPTAARQVFDIIQRLHESGTKIIMTTHDLGMARHLADDVLFLHQGELIEQAPAAQFFASPASAQARAFLSGELLWT